MYRKARESLTAWRWFFRSLKQGDWLWLFIAIIIASLSVTSISYLGQSMKQSMLDKAAQNLGADLILRSSRPLEPRWQSLAQTLGLQTQNSLNTVTMALNPKFDTNFQLVNLRAVEQAEPLRGQIQPSPELPWQPLGADQVWIEPKLIEQLKLEAGGELLLGASQLKVIGSIQPSSLLNPMSQFAPQITMLLSDFAATQLLGPGSRITYELAVAGDPSALQRFRETLKRDAPNFVEVISAHAPSEDLGKTLDRAWLFLDLAALSAVFVAGLSILIASRFYLQRWHSTLALLRAFGGQDRALRRLFAWQFFWIGLSGSGLGVVLGWLVIQLLNPWLEQQFSPFVSAGFLLPMSLGLLSGLLVLWSFAWQAFQEAMATTPLQVLKNLQNKVPFYHWLISFALMLLMLSLIVQWHYLGWILLLGLLLSLVFYSSAAALLRLLKSVHPSSRGWLKISIAGILKQSPLIKIQLISIGLVLFVLMLMTFVRQDLLQAWQNSLPSQAPNTFILNVQPDQQDSVQNLLQSQKIVTAMVPMARGRLIERNQQPLLAEDFTEARAQRLLQREANIAVLAQLPEHNRILAQLPVEDYQGLGVSVEADIAALFGLQLGDQLLFDFAGQTRQYQVRSLRQVQWQSFELNFFFIVEPDSTQSLPISYISSFYQSSAVQRNALTQQLAQEAPGVLLVDVEQIIQQIRQIMDQASGAVSALFVFTLAASIAVLFSATLASQESRIQTWLLLRTLGASSRQIRWIGLTEFALIGLLAGILAASFAQLVSILIAYQLLDSAPHFSPMLWGSTLAISLLILLSVGWLSQKPFLRMSANQLKRHLKS
ncbi:MAG: FtsX-like permease family protein [Thiotrichales bacterium]|nr:FtsX-like permease family protein [Thiotrichales bacterium]